MPGGRTCARRAIPKIEKPVPGEEEEEETANPTGWKPQQLPPEVTHEQDARSFIAPYGVHIRMTESYRFRNLMRRNLNGSPSGENEI